MWVNKELFRLLIKNTLFKGSSEKYLKSSLKPKNLIKHKDGEIIYSCDEEASELYLVVEGEVKIKFRKEKFVEFKILFDFFGEAELLEESKRFSYAVANRDCVLYKMSISELNELCEGSSSIFTNLNRKDKQGIKEQNEASSADLYTILNSDKLNEKNNVIDFNQEKEEEILKKLSDEDLDSFLKEHKTKHELNSDLTDIQNLKDEDLEDLSSDK